MPLWKVSYNVLENGRHETGLAKQWDLLLFGCSPNLLPEFGGAVALVTYIKKTILFEGGRAYPSW